MRRLSIASTAVALAALLLVWLTGCGKTRFAFEISIRHQPDTVPAEIHRRDAVTSKQKLDKARHAAEIERMRGQVDVIANENMRLRAKLTHPLPRPVIPGT